MDAIQAQGANLRDLKKKKNAAGRVARTRWLSTPHVSPNLQLSSPPLKSPQQMYWEPDSIDLSLSKHYQAVQYYR